MSMTLARTILDAQLETVSGLPPLQKENIRFKPETNVPWSRSTLLPGMTLPETLGANGKNRLQGIYQIDLFYPAEKGTTNSGEMADAVIAKFKRGTQLVSGNFLIHIEMAWQDVASKIEGYYHVPISVRWRSSINI